jgi:hypothetical protein
MEEEKVKTVKEIIEEVKVQLELFTEAIRNAEDETYEEDAWFMLDEALGDMKSSIGERYTYGGGTGWIYELYKIQ